VSVAVNALPHGLVMTVLFVHWNVTMEGPLTRSPARAAANLNGQAMIAASAVMYFCATAMESAVCSSSLAQICLQIHHFHASVVLASMVMRVIPTVSLLLHVEGAELARRMASLASVLQVKLVLIVFAMKQIVQPQVLALGMENV